MRTKCRVSHWKSPSHVSMSSRICRWSVYKLLRRYRIMSASFLNISNWIFLHCCLSSTEDVVLPECRTNTECSSDKACINQRCQNPCSSNRCGLNAECITINHHPSCHCQSGLAGDPQLQCFKRKFFLLFPSLSLLFKKLISWKFL